MCKMLDEYLDNYFGADDISEIENLVLADEEILTARYLDKDRRAVRVEGKAKAKRRNKRIYNPSDVTNWGSKTEYNEFHGITPVFHGEDEPVAFIKKSHKNPAKAVFNKVENRKVRYQKFGEDRGNFFEEDVIDPTTGEVLAMKGDPYFDIQFFDEENWKNWEEAKKEGVCGIDYEYNENTNEYMEVYTLRDDGWNPFYTINSNKYLTERLDDIRNQINIHYREEVLKLECERAELMARVHVLDRRIYDANIKYNKKCLMR